MLAEWETKMGLIEDLFGKPPENIVLDDILNLIPQKVEETRNLEYKSPDILDAPEQLSRFISAFLNADGGLIIIGLLEDNPQDKEKLLSPKIFPVASKFEVGCQ